MYKRYSVHRTLLKPSAVCIRAFACVSLLSLLHGPALRAAETAASEAAARLESSGKYLSSDELEGRGIGTKGLDLAAQYIGDQFRALGLKTELYDGKPFQKFTVTTSSKLGPEEKNALKLIGPADSNASSNGEKAAANE